MLLMVNNETLVSSSTLTVTRVYKLAASFRYAFNFDNGKCKQASVSQQKISVYRLLAFSAISAAAHSCRR
jgi:hypothetical protein